MYVVYVLRRKKNMYKMTDDAGEKAHTPVVTVVETCVEGANDMFTFTSYLPGELRLHLLRPKSVFCGMWHAA